MTSGATFSVIGSDVVITGNIKAGVDLHIDGRIEGDIVCASLVQGETSEIHGAVKAETARLSGTVNGSIDARELVICSTAKVLGDVSYEVITVEHGGHVHGQFKHKSAAAARLAQSQDRKLSEARPEAREQQASILPLTQGATG